MKRSFRLLAAVFLAAASVPVLAQRPVDVVKWSVAPGAHAVKSGAAVKVTLTAEVAPGWHLYALTQPKGGPNPLRIAVAEGKPFTIVPGDVTAPPAQVIKDENFDLETRQHDGLVRFIVPIRAAATAPAGAHEVPVEVTFQACGNGICLRPFTQTLPVGLTVSK